MSKSNRLTFREVVTDVVKAFNKALRPFVGRNVAAIKGDRIVFINGRAYTLRTGCKLMIRYARKCHHHYYSDNNLRKKFHDVLFHQWYFERPAMEMAEDVRHEDMRPLCQRKTSGRGLMVLKRNKCGAQYRTSGLHRTEY